MSQFGQDLQDLQDNILLAVLVDVRAICAVVL